MRIFSLDVGTIGITEFDSMPTGRNPMIPTWSDSSNGRLHNWQWILDQSEFRRFSFVELELLMNHSMIE